MYRQSKFLDTMNFVKEIYAVGVKAVHPRLLIKTHLKKEENIIHIKNCQFIMNKNVYLIGFGKAVIGMIKPIEELLKISENESHLVNGIISVPLGIQKTFADKSAYLIGVDSKITVYEGAKDNIPDEAAQYAATCMMELTEKLSDKDLLIVLISGGGSALFPIPLEPLILNDKRKLINLLSKAGASINELNTVRKAISKTKGGKLAQKTNAKILSIIISDVINNPLDIIASGPTYPNTDSSNAPKAILDKYNIPISDKLFEIFKETKFSKSPQTFHNVENIIIGSNETALEACMNKVTSTFEESPQAIILSSKIKGNSTKIGESIALFAEAVIDIIIEEKSTISTELLNHLCIPQEQQCLLPQFILESARKKRPMVFILGGETTVVVKGNGLGGRSQEMVLSASLELKKLLDTKKFFGEVVFLSGGTDGIDGPTDAAGSLTFWHNTTMHSDASCHKTFRSQVDEAVEEGLDPSTYLENNDSYSYFAQLAGGKYHLKPGHTGTNVMDLQILWISLA